MGFKTLTISEEAYRKLKRLKGKNESFTDVILKLGEGHGDISRYAGAWSDMTDEEARELAETFREMWSKWKPTKSAWTRRSS
jgi:predicted CopG family antitoxin